MLVDDGGMPLHFANRYTYSMIEKRGGSIHSVEQALFIISRAYLWSELWSINLDQILFYGDFLNLDQVSDLIDFIQFNSSTQHKILEFKLNTKDDYGNNRSNIVSFRNISNFEYEYTSTRVYANRLRTLRKFLSWTIIERRAQRINTSQDVEDRYKFALVKLSESIPRLRTREDNEQLEAVDLDIIQHIDNRFG